MTSAKPDDPRVDPVARFGTPEKVLWSKTLTREQKIEILRSWHYDLAEQALAMEEGMPGEDPNLTRRVILALEELAGPLDIEQTGPAKQHGIPRNAVSGKR
jgi:hypothetical protein